MPHPLDNLWETYVEEAREFLGLHCREHAEFVASEDDVASSSGAEVTTSGDEEQANDFPVPCVRTRPASSFRSEQMGPTPSPLGREHADLPPVLFGSAEVRGELASQASYIAELEALLAKSGIPGTGAGLKSGTSCAGCSSHEPSIALTLRQSNRMLLAKVYNLQRQLQQVRHSPRYQL